MKTKLLYGLVFLFAQANAQQLVMTSLRSGNTEIFMTNIQTGTAVNLSIAPASEERYPAVSYDGQWVVFTSNRGIGNEYYRLYLMNITEKKAMVLTKDSAEVAYLPSWSADGKLILYNLGKSSSAVLIDRKGNVIRKYSNVRDAFLSPNGKKIAFTRNCKNGFCLFVMESDGNNVQQLTLTPNALGAVGPVFSPDGKRIAYVDRPDSTKEVLEIFVCQTNGSMPQQLTKLNAISTSPAWSVDGKQLSFRVTATAFWRNDQMREKAYAEKVGDMRPVWIINADGSSAKLVEPLKYQCGIDGSRAVWIK